MSIFFHPIRVLHLIEHLKIGGAERLVADLVDSLDKNQVLNIICVYREIGPFGIDLQKKGHNIILLRKDILTYSLPKSISFFKPLLLFIESIFFIFRLAKLMRQHKVQVLHSHMFSANLWGRLASLFGGKPAVITTEHNVNGNLSSLKHRIINRLLVPLSYRIVAVSDQVLEAVVSTQNLPREKLIVIHNGIRINIAKEPDSLLSNILNQEVKGSSPRIISIGRLVRQKRHDLLLQALKLCAEYVPSFSCWIIGDGPERNKLEQLTHELNLRDKVFFLGERFDARRLMTFANILVNTSDWEGFPITLLEAMAEGLPIVATDIAANREIIQSSEIGILVEAGNVQAIASGICKLFKYPEFAKSLARKGQDIVKDLYDIDKISVIWIKLYHEALNERR